MLLLLLAALQAPDSDGAVILRCDPAAFRLSIGGEGGAPDTPYPIERRVAVETLMAAIPNHKGEAQYRGRLTRWEQCGPYSIRLIGDAFNANVQGRNGALPTFARAAVFLDNRLIYPADTIDGVRLGACLRDVDVCDGGWAARVTFASARQRTTITETIETTLASEVDAASDTQTVRTTSIAEFPDLWPRDPARYDATGLIKPRP